nr:hypothetical protein [Tanacetum cinerariifolium]
PDGAQHHDVRPVAGQPVIPVGEREVLAITLRCHVEGFFVQSPGAVAIQRQFLAPVDHGLIALVELV